MRVLHRKLLVRYSPYTVHSIVLFLVCKQGDHESPFLVGWVFCVKAPSQLIGTDRDKQEITHIGRKVYGVFTISTAYYVSKSINKINIKNIKAIFDRDTLAIQKRDKSIRAKASKSTGHLATQWEGGSRSIAASSTEKRISNSLAEEWKRRDKKRKLLELIEWDFFLPLSTVYCAIRACSQYKGILLKI